MTVDITLQYFDGCSNWEVADRDLKEAIRLLDLDTEISCCGAMTPASLPI